MSAVTRIVIEEIIIIITLIMVNIHLNIMIVENLVISRKIVDPEELTILIEIIIIEITIIKIINKTEDKIPT